jgi:hypothetical protein
VSAEDKQVDIVLSDLRRHSLCCPADSDDWINRYSFDRYSLRHAIELLVSVEATKIGFVWNDVRKVDLGRASLRQR